MRALMKNGIPFALSHLANGADAGRLLLDRMQSVAADHLILEIDADGADLDQLGDVGGGSCRLGRIGALEINRERQVVDGGDRSHRCDKRFQRDLLAVGIALGCGDRPAAGRKRLCSCLGDGLGRPGIPDIVKDERIALLMQRAERLRLFRLVH